MALKKIKKISLRLLYSAMFHIGVNYLGFQISTNTDKRPYKIAFMYFEFCLRVSSNPPTFLYLLLSVNFIVNLI
jgi:hypothetical protein